MTMTKLLSELEVCSALGVSEATLKSMIRRGEFPQALRIGLRKRVWLAIDLEKFIEKVTALREAQLISGVEARPTDLVS